MSRQKKDAEANWKSQVLLLLSFFPTGFTIKDNFYLINCCKIPLIILFEQKAWEVAQAPFKNLLMMGFMMWMAGSTVHLFSIGITFSALWQPISALQGVGKGKMRQIASRFVFISLTFIYSDFSM